jgi:hypothetical protein
LAYDGLAHFLPATLEMIMEITAVSLFRRIVAFHLFALVLAGLFMSPLQAEEIADAAKVRITGLYTLQEWQEGGEIFRSPQVEGRLVILNGIFITILDNRMKQSSRTTTVLIGTYFFNPGKFSYGYHDVSVFTESADATSVSHKPLWEGMRTFTTSIDGDAVRLREDNGSREFVFTDEGLDYFVDGKVLRKWRRTTDK